MKKLLFALLLMLAISSAFSQTNFKWLKSDTISKSKSELFSDTKSYIAENFPDSIGFQTENQDTIILNGKISKYLNKANVYIYAYNIKFILNQSKYTIIIDSVYCLSAFYFNTIYYVTEVKKIEPFEGENCPKTGRLYGGISKNQAIEMMESLKEDLQYILDDYEKNIKKRNIPIIKEKFVDAVNPITKNEIMLNSISVNEIKLNTISDSVRLLEKKFLDFSKNYQSDKKEIELSGLYLKKAANNSFAGMALLVVSAGCSVLGAVYQTKSTLSKTKSMKTSNSDVASGSFIAGGIFALTSLICYISVPVNIHKAGEKLHIIK